MPAAGGARLDALAAVPGGLARSPPALFAFLRDQLDPTSPVAARAAAADVLARARSSTTSLLALADARRRPPGRSRSTGCSTRSTSRPTRRSGSALVAALTASPAWPALRAATLKPRLAKFGPSRSATAGRGAVRAAERRRPKQKARARAAAGRARRRRRPPRPGGLQRPEGGLLACHADRLRRRQGRPRPDADRPGPHRARPAGVDRLPERQLRPQLRAGDGRDHRTARSSTALLQERRPDEVVLAVAADQEVRIPATRSRRCSRARVSVMPAGLDQQLTRRSWPTWSRSWGVQDSSTRQVRGRCPASAQRGGAPALRRFNGCSIMAVGEDRSLATMRKRGRAAEERSVDRQHDSRFRAPALTRSHGLAGLPCHPPSCRSNDVR